MCLSNFEVVYWLVIFAIYPNITVCTLLYGPLVLWMEHTDFHTPMHWSKTPEPIDIKLDLDDYVGILGTSPHTQALVYLKKLLINNACK